MACGNNCSCNQDDSRRDFLKKELLGGIGALSCKAKKVERQGHATSDERVYYTCSMHPQVMQS